MLIPRIVPAVLGTLSILATLALLVLLIVLAHSTSGTATLSVTITAIISATLETLCLAFLCWLFSSDLTGSSQRRPTKSNGIWFGSTLLLSAVGVALSVAALVCLSAVAATLPSKISGSDPTVYLVGSSVVLGIAFATQLMFLVVHFIAGRLNREGRLESVHTVEDSQQSRHHHYVKSIPYSQTSPHAQRTRGSSSMESRSRSSSIGGRSPSETISSIRSSFSSVVRPVSSKTRLISGSQRSSKSQRSPKRPPSLDSSAWKEPALAAIDGFDTWDTSAVDPQNRQTVLDSSPLPGRFLETIPASPTTSRSPSPGTPLDLEPPRTRRRSRSYSPASLRTVKPPRPPFTLHTAASESHIHPLFRSDSPTPPPAVTPGTVVTAAPNAGQVISDRQSIRSLNRMRSGSLPVAPSPLSRQGSFDSFARKSETSSPEVPESRETTPIPPPLEMERKMTPPIPDWILSAGSRKSLHGYNSRKFKEHESEGEGI